ncbi:MAG: hypothetical protein ACLP07_12850 [Terracidiphilus sp.]
MEPRNIGRALGIGVRVAGRIAGQRVASPAPSGASPPHPKAQSVAAGPSLVSQAQTAERIAARTGPNLSKGIGGLLRPFRRVGGVVWLEATGTFFLLFAALFALRLWQNWSGIGAISRDFSIGAGVVFLYLGVSSFWRARRR